MNSFEKLGLTQKTLPHIAAKGFTRPTPIQELTIPAMLGGETDIVAQAGTGTGKTGAFGLPLVELIEPGAGHVQALILVPTRELALQVASEIKSYCGTGRGALRVETIYGGQSIRDQIRALKMGVDIAVGTPGRVIDHIERGTLQLAKISFAVLDEADEMLNMGFIDDIERILAESGPERKTLLFSATMPDRIRKTAEKYMKEYRVLTAEAVNGGKRLIEQSCYVVPGGLRSEALKRIIRIEPAFYGMVFCRTRAESDHVARDLSASGYLAEAIHGDISQAQREKILGRFRAKTLSILVATDVAARGIDVNDLTHVINHSLPQDFANYVHRIGRTGRAGKNGKAITLITHSERRILPRLERISGGTIEIKRIPTIEEISKSEEHVLEQKIKDLVGDPKSGKYVDLASRLLNGHSPVEVLAAAIEALEEKTPLDTLEDDRLFTQGPSERPRGSRPYGGGGYRGRFESRGEGAGERDGYKKREGFKKRPADGKRDSEKKPWGAKDKKPFKAKKF